jgi:hypothetical protein
MNPQGDQSNKVLRSVTTARGSVYTYLPDGRTQRFKKATNELHEPQDVLVFIPPWELIKDEAPKLYPRIFNNIENSAYYHELLLEYAQYQGRTIRPVDEKGALVESNKQAREAGRVFLAFIDKNNPECSFTLPVSVDPKPGWNSFDTRKFKDKNGEEFRERHIGNEVVNIEYQQKTSHSGMGLH